ncbi:putative bifunctional diguanylate cyclase/phosphodiesterase [Planomicrobium okeanokoites]|uniref:putative bifunctional diguanylate cyclase/phosphodiesterase n=1 Tax=Planomicrobium okeanokoites TaxID=244 RepID=UPI002490349D|nr:bifunctional diguanylate cyclase/phosphodiesterase [Planomicrobium okeanokoites]
MLKQMLFPITILSLAIALFYSWTLTFQGDPWLVTTGTNVLQILAGTLSFIWLYQAYRSADTKHKSFWLLLQLALILYTAGNWIWLILQFSQGTENSTILSSVVWLSSYLIFLVALIFKTRELSNEFSENSYLFNIAVFIITVASISFHYLINPVLELSGESWLITMTAIIYPVADITILLVVSILYYLIRKNKQQEVLLFLLIGFFIQIAADFLYVYVSYKESYQPGHLVDMLWLLSVLLFGFSGYYSKSDKRNELWKLKSTANDKGTAFPYVSILILLMLVMHSYQFDFNGLSSGLLIIFIMVLGRQLQVLLRNRQLVEQYRYLAYHDQLTDLRNRSSFNEEIEHFLADYPTKQMALLLIDLDQFKVVNDTMGHHIGDLVLVKTAERLQAALDPDMLLYRLGGDEFIIVVLDATDEKCEAVANKLLENFNESLDVEEYQINITPSIGISKYPEHGYTPEDLMKSADAAMYVSKENGKNGYSFFNAELSQEKLRKMTIENALKKAVQRDQFILYYQPKVVLGTRKIIGMEALLRWRHPDLGWVSPVEFIPVAEETGQIVAIGEWVLEEACRQNKQWQDAGYPPLNISVNVSVLQFKHGKFLETVERVLDKTGLDTRYLELEITESIMQNIKESKKILVSLQQMGIKISIDDFGTGYSSLNVLQKLPIDTLKIDKSFVDELDIDELNPMVKAIIDLGLNLDMTLVAEGIESENQMNVLIEHGCTIGQGYLFSKPVAPEDFEGLMQIPGMLAEELEHGIVR